MKNKIKRWLTNVSLIFFSIFISILALEMLLHLINYNNLSKPSSGLSHPSDKPFMIVHPNYGRILLPNFPENEFYFSDSKHSIWSNNIGCFDVPFDFSSPPDIYLAGDSFTWGYVPFKKKYGTLMESYTGLNVIKAGVGGTGTLNQYYKARYILKKTGLPRLLVVGYFIHNDANDDNDFIFKKSKSQIDFEVSTLANPDYEIPRKEIDSIIEYSKRYGTNKLPASPFLQQIKHFFFQHSILWHIAKKPVKDFLHKSLNLANNVHLQSIVMDKNKNHDSFLIDREKYNNNFNSINRFKSFCNNNDIKLLFVLFPSKEQVYPFLSSKTELELEAPNRFLKDFFKKENIVFVDLLPMFKQKANLVPRKHLDSKKDFYWKYDGHWNEKGNLFAGLLISKYILESNLIDIENKDDKLEFIHNKLEKF